MKMDTSLNPQLHKHSVSNWHFLPELPEVNVEVLIAYKYDKKPIQGYWNGKKWIGSIETRDYMNDGFVRDETLNIPEYIYALSNYAKPTSEAGRSNLRTNPHYV